MFVIITMLQDLALHLDRCHHCEQRLPIVKMSVMRTRSAFPDPIINLSF